MRTARSPEADEEGVYTVEQGVEFLLHMDVSCPEGFAGGLYALAFPDGVVPSLGEGTLTADETEIGQWSADGESSRVLRGWKAPRQSRPSPWKFESPLWKTAAK